MAGRQDLHIALASCVDGVAWIGELLYEGCRHGDCVEGEDDASGLVDAGDDGAVVIVEERDYGGVRAVCGVKTRVVLVAERQTVLKGEVAAGVALVDLASLLEKED